MKKTLYFLFLLLSMFTFTSYAAPSNKNTSIEKMFAIMGIDKQFSGGFEAMLPVVDSLATRLQLDANAKEELKNIYRKWFDNDIDRNIMKTKLVDIYSEAFNETEINGLIAFYQSPIGQKFLNKSPELMKLGAQIGMQEAQSKQHLLMERLQPFLEKHKKQ